MISRNGTIDCFDSICAMLTYNAPARSIHRQSINRFDWPDSRMGYLAERSFDGGYTTRTVAQSQQLVEEKRRGICVGLQLF
jgi:hypothetical protein